MIKASIIGGSGYVAGELIRILIHHPEVEILQVYSHSMVDNSIAKAHPDLFMHSNLKFTGEFDSEVDVIFLCMGHGKSRDFLNKHSINPATLIIDLGNDFRLTQDAIWNQRQFSYGLTEFNASRLIGAKSIANPGCFATAIQLALLPFAKENELQEDIHITGITGSTGAGKSLSETSHFSWRNNNLSAYKIFSHQHEEEIKQNLKNCSNANFGELNFVPIRGNFTRGIFASIYFKSSLTKEECQALLKEQYATSPFVFIANDTIHLKQVVNTNYALIHPHVSEGKVHLTICIDNLIKGACGQAVQNMNVALGIPQTTGLFFKPNYF